MAVTFEAVRKNDSKAQVGVHSFVSLSLCLWPSSLSPERKKRDRGRGERWKEDFHGFAKLRVSVVKLNIRDSIPNTEPAMRVCRPRVGWGGGGGKERITGVLCNKHRRAFTSQCTRVIRRAHFLHMHLKSNSHVAQRKERMERNAGSWRMKKTAD